MKKWLATILLGMALVTGSASAEPRGIRNNNPGNIIQTPITWKGEIDCDTREEKFECFQSPGYGIRAIYKNLEAYYTKYGLSEVSDIVERWTVGDPDHIQGRYTAFVVQGCGSSYSESGLSSSDWASCLVDRIIKFENGYNPYSLEYIKKVYHDTYGDHNFARLGSSRGPVEVVGDVSSGQEGTSRATVKAPTNPGTDSGGSKEVQERGVYVDEKGDSPASGICRSNLAEASASILAGYSSYSWLDRMGERVPVLYGGEGGYELAYREGSGGNPPRHPLNVYDRWAIFRREFGWS